MQNGIFDILPLGKKTPVYVQNISEGHERHW